MLNCTAVPEACYESLRGMHGVRCDDFPTVAFQPEYGALLAAERSLLLSLPVGVSCTANGGL